jgi:hypothetical protein
MQRAAFLLCAGLLLSPTAALADDKPTDAEAKLISAAIADFGCEGGTVEKESEGSGVLEAEDVKCKAGQFDFRLDKEGKVFAITRD